MDNQLQSKIQLLKQHYDGIIIREEHLHSSSANHTSSHVTVVSIEDVRTPTKALSSSSKSTIHHASSSNYVTPASHLQDLIEEEEEGPSDGSPCPEDREWRTPSPSTTSIQRRGSGYRSHGEPDASTPAQKDTKLPSLLRVKMVVYVYMSYFCYNFPSTNISSFASHTFVIFYRVKRAISPSILELYLLRFTLNSGL